MDLQSPDFVNALLNGVLVVPAYYLLAPITGITVWLWKRPKKLGILILVFIPYLSFAVPPFISFYFGYSAIDIAASFISGVLVFLFLSFASGSIQTKNNAKAGNSPSKTP